MGCTKSYVTNDQLIAEFRRRNLEVSETARGVVVILPHILFAYKRSDLSPAARQKVDDIAEIMAAPRAERRSISIEGHTDAIGSEEYNAELSMQRAEMVRQELLANGIRRERVVTRGFGKQRPIAPNTNPDGTDNPEGRAKNRRVEVIIEN